MNDNNNGNKKDSHMCNSDDTIRNDDSNGNDKNSDYTFQQCHVSMVQVLSCQACLRRCDRGS